MEIPENPFDIIKPMYSLHLIDEKRTELLSKNELTNEDKLLLYRLRVDELLWILDDCNGHFEWLKEDYNKLKECFDVREKQ